MHEKFHIQIYIKLYYSLKQQMAITQIKSRIERFLFFAIANHMW